MHHSYPRNDCSIGIRRPGSLPAPSTSRGPLRRRAYASSQLRASAVRSAGACWPPGRCGRSPPEVTVRPIALATPMQSMTRSRRGDSPPSWLDVRPVGATRHGAVATDADRCRIPPLPLSGVVIASTRATTAATPRTPEIAEPVWIGPAWKPCNKVGTSTSSGYFGARVHVRRRLRARPASSLRRDHVHLTRTTDTGVGPHRRPRAVRRGGRAPPDREHPRRRRADVRPRVLRQ